MLGEIIGTSIAAASNAALAKQQFEYNKQLASQQNQYNIDMWRMNNEYNTPQAQMQRFMEAGLNPNLIYGQGTAGNSSAPPQQVVPEAPDYSHVMSDFSKLGQLLDIANRVETLKAQRKENAIRDERKQLISNQNQLATARATQEWGRALAMNSYDSPYQDKLSGEGYFRKLYDLTFERLAKNNMLTSARTSLAATQETLNNLQSNYYRVRNAWQPWQYGVDMGTGILSSLVPFGKLFKRGNDIIKNYNRSYNSNYNYSGQYRIGHNYINQ